MEIISSNKNARLKRVAALLKSKKERSETGLFVIEGLRIVSDAINNSRDLVSEIYISDRLYEEGKADEICQGLPYEVVKASVLDAVCETVTPQGLLAVMKQPGYSLEDMLKAGPLKLLMLEDIQDPGNLGTMVRTAEAAGMAGIIMSKGTVDIFSPKVTRSTMGSIFRVPFLYTDNLPSVIDRLKEAEIGVYAAYLHGGQPYNTVAYGDRRAVLIGNEGNGLSGETVEHSSGRVYIPMAGSIESLNAAVAAAIMMYSL